MENRTKILFIDETHPCLPEAMIKMGFACDFFPQYNEKEIENCIEDYTGIILRSKIIIDKTIIDKAKNLRFIARVGSGMESIDATYAESKGIACINSPEGNRDALGEHALGMLLCLLNNICRANTQIRNGIWQREENRGFEIKDKTIGIIGYGNMGGSFARKMKGFEANVIAYDKYKKGFSDEFVKEVQMEELFEHTDILSLHVPLTEETQNLVTSDYIEKFRKNIYFVNTARGNIVKTTDLVAELKKGKVLGAALDVLEYENHSFEFIDVNNIPDDFQYLLEAENVILTPHIAGWTAESKIRLSMVLAEKIRKLGLISD
jgi:D-3-phosphoglycerate dehydrogenase